jgi:hypothetical protein
MGRTRVLSEVRTMRFEGVLSRYRSGRLSCDEAADVLGMSFSTFYRWRRRYEESGCSGLQDRRVGKVSPHSAPVDEMFKVVDMFEKTTLTSMVSNFTRSCPRTKSRAATPGPRTSCKLLVRSSDEPHRVCRRLLLRR